MLMAIEGIHGAGKTTLIKGLSQRRPDITIFSEGPMAHGETSGLGPNPGISTVVDRLAARTRPALSGRNATPVTSGEYPRGC